MTEEEILMAQQEQVSELVKITEQKVIYHVLLLIRKAREEDATWEELEAAVKDLLNKEL
ncbi:MAG: hypothetical protein IJR58_06975 [Lachnospiraceae bacterium]|nr:hypothetical protein [Lachnospiraceae bacterium]